jgi:predicted Rdx family selenoprotein
MHLAIEEQISIDQPPGIRALHQQLKQQTDTPHSAAHIVMECLGEVLWQAQRDGTTPDNQHYLDCLRRHIK